MVGWLILYDSHVLPEDWENSVATTVQQVSVRGDFKLLSYLDNDKHICQFMPLFSNDSDCLSRNFICKNFITQSDNIKTLSSRRESKTLCLHFSWLWARIMCAFGSLTFSSVTSTSCRRSSSFSLLLSMEDYFSMAESIPWIASFNTSQSLHDILWSWLQSVQ